jgi:hypothetical protein
LSEGSLEYHLSKFTSPWTHGGIPEEKQLYKEFEEYVINNNMGKTFKDMKKDGKVTFDGPKVKDRKPFAPTTQKHKAEKGKGSYARKPPEEDAEFKKGETSEAKKDSLRRMREENKGKKLPPPQKMEMKGGLQKKLKETLGESASIIKFIEAIMTEDHANAHKYLKDTINKKIQEKISQEIEKPLF